jgi:hypothetical protein
MRANAWEGIGKELKIKCKFYVSSLDVRIVCPRLLFEDRQGKYNVNVERSHNHFCRGKAISVTYSEYVSVALVIQHAKRMRRIIIPYLAFLFLPYFSTLFNKRHDFREKKYPLNTKCVF